MTLIGEVNLEGPLIRSKFGDERLFFRHESFDMDITRLEFEEGEVEKARRWSDAEF